MPMTVLCRSLAAGSAPLEAAPLLVDTDPLKHPPDWTVGPSSLTWDRPSGVSNGATQTLFGGATY